MHSHEMVYIYDESGVIGFMYSYDGASLQQYYYQRNMQGDVVAIYSTSGAKAAEYIYDSYGNCTVANAANSQLAFYNPIRYRGYYLDRETGLYYLNARYYNPEWRRFISPDSTEYLDPSSVNGLNLYAYCNNDPVNYADPSGHGAILAALIIGALVGGAIGGIYGGTTAMANGQNVLAGVLIGFGAGALMGAGAGLASLYLAPVIVGQSVIVGGLTYSAGSALAIGTGIAFLTGAIGGMAADALTQKVNDGYVGDWNSVLVSGVQWGLINIASAFLGSLGGPTTNLETGLLTGIFGSVTSSIGMTIDILRNRRAKESNRTCMYGC